MVIVGIELKRKTNHLDMVERWRRWLVRKRGKKWEQQYYQYGERERDYYFASICHRARAMPNYMPSTFSFLSACADRLS